MTREERNYHLTKLMDAHNAGIINNQEYIDQSQAIHRAYYDHTYGQYEAA